jgi:hypothetical protein
MVVVRDNSCGLAPAAACGSEKKAALKIARPDRVVAATRAELRAAIRTSSR